ncbi:hypothetical protein FTI75_14355 [Burkholderia pseudomallei]|uniref:hypothetical protein n=1 Tax=Burkholderia pseudomallei TaxID=28450 RepID=UPI0011B961A8|nr:hypothetical protein [Burkholderia pseudomallei]TXD03962.1 hypothetical protein FTI75_14355 [Burkholderia pseudomallei]
MIFTGKQTWKSYYTVINPLGWDFLPPQGRFPQRSETGRFVTAKGQPSRRFHGRACSFARMSNALEKNAATTGRCRVLINESLSFHSRANTGATNHGAENAKS